MAFPHRVEMFVLRQSYPVVGVSGVVDFFQNGTMVWPAAVVYSRRTTSGLGASCSGYLSGVHEASRRADNGDLVGYPMSAGRTHQHSADGQVVHVHEPYKPHPMSHRPHGTLDHYCF